MTKHNSNKEEKRIKILFVSEDIWPHCPDFSYWVASVVGIRVLCAWLKLVWSLQASFCLAVSRFADNSWQPLKEGGARAELFLTCDKIDCIFNGKEQQSEQALLLSPPSFPFPSTPCLPVFCHAGSSLCPASLVLQCRQATAHTQLAGLSGACPTSTYKHMMKICLKEYGWCGYFCYINIRGRSRNIMV